jgi:hypothetical protein
MMYEPQIREVLRQAAALVRQGWCKNALAKDKDGKWAAPRDPRAVCWCAAGAIQKICGGPNDGWEAAAALRNVLFMDIQTWNDTYARDGEHVASKMEEAIRTTV